ncbi:MAG: TIGR02996 domain-containing protein [Alphaproteobacteria bacterium]|nr:TIGR02996 domain-containing protein [Alphaproteobacteria bacterium]
MERALLAELDRDPTDAHTWAVYADLLVENGDPRGELIAVELAMEAAGASVDELEERRHQLLTKHARALFGETGGRAVKSGMLDISHQRGFVRRLRYAGGPQLRHRRQIGWLLEVLAAPPCHFLESLDLAWTDLASLDPVPTGHLRSLDVHHTLLGSLKGVEAMVKLESLDIGDTGVRDLQPLHGLTALRALDLRGTRADAAEVRRLREARPGLQITEGRRDRW